MTNPPLIGIELGQHARARIAIDLVDLGAAVLCRDPRRDDETPWLVDLLIGLDRQLTQIEHNLSYYFSPNTHLIGEALALYVAGRALPELDPNGHRAALGAAGAPERDRASDCR